MKGYALDKDEDGFQSSVIVRATHLTNAAAVELSIAAARKVYTDSGHPPPPFPDNALMLAPCSILVTERSDVGTGERIGHIQFLQPDGDMGFDGALFDQVW